MRALSPAKLIATNASAERGGEWFRLARTDDGILCVESISDATLTRAAQNPPPSWAFGGDVPPHISRQLTDDDDPDQVARVLGRALHALGYSTNLGGEVADAAAKQTPPTTDAAAVSGEASPSTDRRPSELPALTADTITDEQIRELRDASCECRPHPRFREDHAAQHDCDIETYEVCDVALFDRHSRGADERRAAARARCAELINARRKESDRG